MQNTAVVTEAKQVQELRAFAGRAYEPESGKQESEGLILLTRKERGLALLYKCAIVLLSIQGSCLG